MEVEVVVIMIGVVMMEEAEAGMEKDDDAVIEAVLAYAHEFFPEECVIHSQ